MIADNGRRLFSRRKSRDFFGTPPMAFNPAPESFAGGVTASPPGCRDIAAPAFPALLRMRNAP